MIAALTALEGVVLFRAELSRDERGSFARLYDRDALLAAGCTVDFPQWSVAHNATAGTLRGMHFNAPPHEEAKLIRVVAGAIYDVLVDVRPQSGHFGAWAGFELRADAGTALFVPPGYAHGYQTLADETIVTYAISLPYVAESARGVSALDPALAIDWPLPPGTMSARDRDLPSLATYRREAG